jgi:RNase P/RNase MRP subunit POP5
VIANATYRCIGSEPKDAGMTDIYIHPASGLKIIDIIVNGVSKRLGDLTIDENFGLVVIDEELERGDVVQCIYKTLPRFTVALPTMSEFDPLDFAEGEFA